MFDSLGASISDFCVYILDNIICYDIEPFECKFFEADLLDV